MTRSEQAARRKIRAELRAKRRFDPATRTARVMAKAAPVETAKHSALHRLQQVLTRQQYEAGCRLRDDWLDHLDVKATGIPGDAHGGGGGVPHERLLRQVKALASFREAQAALSLETMSPVTAVCTGDRMPAVLAAKSEGGLSEVEILLRLKRGLDELVRYYGGGK